MRSVATGSLSFVRITLRRPGSTLFPYTTLFRSLPSLIRSDIPPDLESICLKCLAKEPGQRYPSAKAMAEALREFLDAPPPAGRAFPTVPGREGVERVTQGRRGGWYWARQPRPPRAA